MNWLSLLGIFAKPLGSMLNNALSAGSGAVILWAVSKGADAGWVAPAVAGITLAISQTISGLAATQGVQIPIINQDTTNGVKVVSANSPSPAVNAPGK